MKNVASRCWC